MNNFNVNEIVKGKVCGMFVIVGFRSDLDESEVYAQLKSIDPETQKPERGEFALPLSALRKA